MAINLIKIKREIEKILGEEVVSIKKTRFGLHNENYILRTKLNYLFTKISRSKLLKKQYYFLKDNMGKLNVPKAIKFSNINGLGKDILFLELIRGKHLDLNKLNKKQILNLAKEISRIHKIKKIRYSNNFSAKPINSGKIYDYAYDFIQNTVLKRYEKFSFKVKNLREKEIIEKSIKILKAEVDNLKKINIKEFSLLHTDLGKNNIIWKKNNPFFIDWDEKIFGDPADEVGYIFAINNSKESFRSIFLKTYLNSQADSTFKQRVKLYELKNRLFDVLWALSKTQNKTSIYDGYYKKRLRNLKKYLSVNF